MNSVRSMRPTFLSRSEFVLPRTGGELAQYLAGCDAAGRIGGGDPKNVGPIAFDHSN
jgi:hypothetical protein